MLILFVKFKKNAAAFSSFLCETLALIYRKLSETCQLIKLLRQHCKIAVHIEGKQIAIFAFS